MPQDPNETTDNSEGMAVNGPPKYQKPANSQQFTSLSSIPDKILQFLNALPITGNVVEWIDAFRSLLMELFADIDHVHVRVNLHCPLMADDDAPVPAASGRDMALGRRSQHRIENAEPLMAGDSAGTIPDGQYQEPLSFEYRYVGDVYLGTIVLHREIGKPPIPPETQATMAGLEPFMVFALSDLVARYSYAKPISRVFHEVLRGIALERLLTKRELQVLTLHLFGRKYDEISRRLYISIDTVKKHVKRIHRKTGARSATELFARYFAPLIDKEGEMSREK